MSEPAGQPSLRDHLANERTLLAWVRTAITFIGLGFLVDRLALDTGAPTWEAYAGIGLVLVGSVIALAGAYSYLNTRRQLATGSFRPAVAMHLVIVALVVIVGLVVAALLVAS